MIYDSITEEKKINDLIENAVFKIFDKHFNLHNDNKNKLHYAFLCEKDFVTEDVIDKLKNYKEKIIIDVIFESNIPSTDKQYDVIIDLKFIENGNILNKIKHLRQYYLIDENPYYYSFIPEFKFDEIQKLKIRENLEVKIINIYNDENNAEYEPTIKIEEEDVFEIFENIIDKLVNENNKKLLDKRITNLYRNLGPYDEINEDLIYDYIYSNQKEILEKRKINYSLLTGKEGFITLRICLDNSSKITEHDKE